MEKQAWSSLKRLAILAILGACLYALGSRVQTVQPQKSTKIRLFGTVIEANREFKQSGRLLSAVAEDPVSNPDSGDHENLGKPKASLQAEEAPTEENPSEEGQQQGEEEGKEDFKEREEEAEGHEPGEVLITYIVTILLVLGGVCREIKKMTGVPYTPQLLLVGIILGTYATNLGVIGNAFHLLMQINPHGILMIFIPTIIFESAFNSDPFTIKRQIWQILLLAVPGVVLGAFLITIEFNYILGYYEELNIWAGFTFGAIVCATDPVAVVALLKELGTPLKFNVLLEGESLLNDGTAMVFYIVFSSIYKAKGVTLLGILWKFIQLSFGGVLLGAIACWMAIFWLRRIVKDEILTIAITFMACYATFFVGEVYLGVSGILAIVSLGVLMAMFGKVKINPESEHALHTVWTFIQYVLETIIFVLTGGYIGYYTIYSDQSSITSSDWVKMIIFYFLMTLARFIMILVFSPLMNMTGYPVGKKDIFILSYGGLRGAIALCLGLMVYTDEEFSQRFRDLVLFYLTGMITMTVLLNGLTMKWVMEKVDIFPENKLKQKVKNTLTRGLFITGVTHEHKIKNNRFLSLANWSNVEELSGLRDIVRNQTKDFSGQELQHLVANPINLNEDANMIEIRYRFYRLIKAQFWEKFEESFCSSSVVSALNECIDFCMDNLEQKVWVYECVSDNIIATDKLQNMLSWRNTILVGPIYKSFINSYLSTTYEMLSTLIVSLEDLLESKPNIPLNPKCVKLVIKEISENKNKAEQQMFLLCDVFPDLISSLQNKQAAQMILRAQKEELNDDFHKGLITEEEFSDFIDSLNKRINQLNHKSLSWEIGGVKDFSLVSPIFHCLSESDLLTLKKNHKLNRFSPGSVIYQKDQPVYGIFIISKGMVEEQEVCEELNTRFGLGSILSWLNILIPGGVAKSTLVAINSVTAYYIPKETILDIFQRNPNFEETIYKIALPDLMRLYPPSTGLSLELTEELVAAIQKDSKLITKQPGELITLDYGGLLVSGEVATLEDGIPIVNPEGAPSPQYLLPGAGGRGYKVIKTIKIIRFDSSILEVFDGQEEVRKSVFTGGFGHSHSLSQPNTNLSPMKADLGKGFGGGSHKPSMRGSFLSLMNKEQDIDKAFEQLIRNRYMHWLN